MKMGTFIFFDAKNRRFLALKPDFIEEMGTFIFLPSKIGPQAHVKGVFERPKR